MKKENYGDNPNVPKGLDKTSPLETDPTKRSGLVPKTRHTIKEYLKKFRGVYNKI